ncbi:isopeptide-forming domain-containing fimbrial protein [Lampropedia aestuarii]|nr:isopeptide-forming domain-containing fimbrial protein [Lampropedia aestuarii]MDH5857640.1 isopeptide-forming domain-containing fimbrial protein [Lampropedia aestuarii]
MTGNTATTTGNQNGVQSIKAGTLLGLPNTVFNIEEAASGMPNLNAYQTSWRCADEEGGGDVEIASGVGATGSFTMPSGSGVGAQVVCSFTNELKPDPIHPAIKLSKTAYPASGTAVVAGQVVTFTLNVDVADGPTQSDVVLTDEMGAGLTFGAVTSAGAFTHDAAAGTFTLPAGQANGSYSVSYTATVNAGANVSAGNSVSGTGGGNPNDPSAPNPSCEGNCSTTHPVHPAIKLSKTANPASGTAVVAGQVVTFTLNVDVANGPTQSDVVLTDEMGAGLTFGAVTSAGAFTHDAAAGTFTLPAGQANGSYSVSYTATVNAGANVSAGNSVSGTGGGNPNDPSAPNPSCEGNCSTTHPVHPAIKLSKTANPASGTAVVAGQVVTFTLNVDVANGPTQSDVVLTDEMGAGLTFGAVTSAGAFTHDAAAGTFTLPAGQANGSYSVSYTATVDAGANVSAGNSVSGTGGGNPNDPSAPNPVCSGACSTEHPLLPTISLSKTASPAVGTVVAPGQVVTYTLSVHVANAPTQTPIVLTDVLGKGLTFSSVVAAGGFTHDAVAGTFTLAAGQASGTYTVTYSTTVDTGASSTVVNHVTGKGGGNPGDPRGSDPVCVPGECETSHPIRPGEPVPVPVGSLWWWLAMGAGLGVMARRKSARAL